MDSSGDNGQRSIEWTDLKPTAIDRHQEYVLIAHLILAIIISILSLSGGLVSWATGTGIMTPILLFVTGVTYGIVTGINWYRDEFVPHLCRTSMIPEFEVDRFLNYKLMHRRTILVAGYLSTGIIQFVWSIVTGILVPSGEPLIVIGLFLFIFFLLYIVLYLIVLLVWLSLFDNILRLTFSDVNHIIALDDKMLKDKKTRKEEMDLENM